MKRRFSILELLAFVPIVALVHSVLGDSLSVGKEWILLGIGFFILQFKARAEGNRWNSLIISIAYAFAICSKFSRLYFPNTGSFAGYATASAIISVIYVFTVILFPVYEIPKLIHLGQPNYHTTTVSCSEFTLPNNSSNVTVYYPANEPEGEEPAANDEAVMLESDYWQNLYSTVRRSFPWIPLRILDFAGSYYQRYSIRVTTKLPIVKRKVLKPIIFSHGLGASRNAYSIIHKQLASLGYVVFSLEHYDVLREEAVEQTKDKLLKKHKLHEIKTQELETRLQVFKDVLDLINNPKLLTELFGQPISVDASNVIAMGHSFGGATAQLAAMRYSKQIKATVCLDPWLFPLSDEDIDTPVQVPVLYINSETFSKSLPWSDIEGKNDLVWSKLAKKEKSLHCIIKDMDHVCQGDQGLLFSTEMRLAGLIRYPHRLLEFNLYNVKIIEYYLQNIVFSGKDSTSSTTNTYNEQRFLEGMNTGIIAPLRKDSFEYFRQELVCDFNANEIFTFEFKGESPF